MISVVACSDHQAPFHDRAMHKAFCDRLRRAPPNLLAVLGDLIDNQPLSRFVNKTPNITSLQENLDSAHQILADYRSACGDATKIVMLPGNHEQRLMTTILTKVPEFAALTLAKSNKEVLTMQNLLRLDDLKVEWVAGELDSWPHTQLHLSSRLSLGHGWVARQGAGQSALATIQHIRRSFIMGHTHRSAIVCRTTHEPKARKTMLHVGVELGTMCDIHNGLGYAVEPDWQNSYADFFLYPDGTFSMPQLHIWANKRWI